ncbi:hypothetical protein M1843_00445 [Isoptericola sp. 4D.3]|jgi:hypothetical protein|uniref:Uncharacterized protein n=1 Tax=Isoptericola peretonis TaxID=2918523 RepID=A0ABT0IYA4_9MICO|nr:hypothetical protein [Isoptericola sp. 4D.3]
MSTVPEDAGRDAGLEGTDDTTSLVEDVLAPDAPETPDDPAGVEAVAQEYTPRHARPDLDGEAAEADVVEQSQEVPHPDDPDAVDEA